MNEFSIVPTYENKKIYDKATFLRLRERDRSAQAQAINQFRLDLVHKYTGESDRVLDIGIGAGTFMEKHGNCLGYDINPYAVEMLIKKHLWFDPYTDDFEAANIAAVTFFDSLEHIESPSEILNRLKRQLVIVSIPIFYSRQHMMNSKHFKPGEHIWHFTRLQFEAYMAGRRFGIVEERMDETQLGRTDIKTFVLKRLRPGTHWD